MADLTVADVVGRKKLTAFSTCVGTLRANRSSFKAIADVARTIPVVTSAIVTCPLVDRTDCSAADLARDSVGGACSVRTPRLVTGPNRPAVCMVALQMPSCQAVVPVAMLTAFRAWSGRHLRFRCASQRVVKKRSRQFCADTIRGNGESVLDKRNNNFLNGKQDHLWSCSVTLLQLFNFKSLVLLQVLPASRGHVPAFCVIVRIDTAQLAVKFLFEMPASLAHHAL